MLQVPKAAHATGDFASKVVTAPIHFSGQQAGRACRYLHQQGIRNEHITAVSGAAAGVLATTLLVKCASGTQCRVCCFVALCGRQCNGCTSRTMGLVLKTVENSVGHATGTAGLDVLDNGLLLQV